MEQIVLIIHVVAAISIVALVLIQQGKGSDVGAAFGSGSSNTMFGSQGALPFFMKLTASCALVFFLTSLYLAHLAHEHVRYNKPMSLPAIAPASKRKVPSLPVSSMPLPVASGASSKLGAVNKGQLGPMNKVNNKK